MCSVESTDTGNTPYGWLPTRSTGSGPRASTASSIEPGGVGGVVCGHHRVDQVSQRLQPCGDDELPHVAPGLPNPAVSTIDVTEALLG